MARTILNDHSTPKHFLAEVVNTTCYLQNIIYIRPILKKTPYELWKGRKPNISYFPPFGCQCFILNTKDNLGKFDSKCDYGIFLGYFESSKAYRVYNSRTLIVEEAIHVIFNDNKPNSTMSKVDEFFVEMKIENIVKSTAASNQDKLMSNLLMDDQPEEVREPIGSLLRKHHPESRIIGDPRDKVQTRNSLKHTTLLSEIESKHIDDAMSDEY